MHVRPFLFLFLLTCGRLAVFFQGEFWSVTFMETIQLSFLKLKLSWQINLPNLPYSVKIKNPLNIRELNILNFISF